MTKDFAEELYALVEVEFDTATLLKPPRISETPLDDLIRSLAPLVVIQQAAEAGAPPLHSNSDPSAHHAPALTILTAEDSVAIHGVEYRCISFAGFESGSCTNSDPAWILRLTLDDLGFPMVFEVQEPRDGGVDRVFAARSLESAAAATFGPPLPGRRFSAEADRTDAPNTIVARIVEDGPEPMGPYVYYRPSAAPGVTTLLCRCSPAQANEFSASQNYQFEKISSEDFRRRTAGLHRSSLPLDRRLRIPPGFGKQRPAATNR